MEKLHNHRQYYIRQHNILLIMAREWVGDVDVIVSTWKCIHGRVVGKYNVRTISW